MGGMIAKAIADEARKKVEENSEKLADIASISILDKRFNVKTDGTDTTAAFKEVLDYAVSNNSRVLVPPMTYTVANLNIPSKSDIHFYTGSKMKLVPNSPFNTRCVIISRVENVNISGLFEIDGNLDTITNGNEHMHGLFIYNAENVFIDSVYSYDCYGDNVSISGGSGNEGDYSQNINIRNMRAVRAGRKNLVIEHVDNLNVDVANLDNSTGGIDNKGGNSIDVEPFNISGSTKIFTVNLGKVTTIGCGNDFTAGTDIANAERFIVNIDTLISNVLDLPTNDIALNGGGWKTAIYSYAITINVNCFVAYLANTKTDLGDGTFTQATKALWVQHGGQITIDDTKIYGGCDAAEVINVSLGTEQPTVKLNKLLIDSPLSYGIKNERGNLVVGTLKVRNLLNRVIYGDTLSNNLIKIGLLDIENSCTTSIFELSSGTTVSTARIIFENVKVTDNRTTKVTSFIRSSDRNVVNVIRLGSVDLETGMSLLAMTGVLTTDSDVSIKTLSHSPLGSLVYVFTNPEGKVTADKGTIAINKSGISGSIFYLKESDGVNTGWRAI